MANQFKTFLLLGLMTTLIILIGQLLGGRNGMYLAFVVAAAMNFGSYWFSGDLALKMNHAQIVDREQAPELYQLVEHLAERAGIPCPKVAIVEDPSPNAFATGRNPQHAVVAVTRGLLNMMNREELAGVISHELGHVKNRDILISALAATMAGAIMLLANIAKMSLIFGGGGQNNDRQGGNPIAVILVALLAPIAAMLVQMAISRSREYQADQTGADIAGTPYGLANALKKLGQISATRPTASANPSTAHMYIVNPLAGLSLASLFATHPPIDERIHRLLGELP